MKIVVFGNCLLTTSSFQALVQNNMVEGLCTSDSSEEETLFIQWIARQAKIHLLTVNKLNIEQKLGKWLKLLSPDVVFVMTFAYKIPTKALNIPRLGFYNFHFGKLPEYRGPQPIFWELVNREPIGAITVHKIDDKLDHGPIAIMEEIPIRPTDTFGMHIVNLSFNAVGVMLNLVAQLQNDPDNLALTEQDHSKAKYYNKPKQPDVTINWEKQDSRQINSLVKACNPWNKGAFTSIRNCTLRIVEISVCDEPVGERIFPGTIIKADRKDGILVVCKDQRAVKIEIVYMVEGFLPGTRLLDLGIKKGETFTRPDK